MNTTPTNQQVIAALKHLAGGKALDVVAAILKLPEDTIRTIAEQNGWPDREKLSWAVDMLVDKQLAAEKALPTATPPSGVRVTDSPRPSPAPAPAAPLTQPDEIRVLLNTAKGHPSKRIQAAADRVFDHLDRLRALLREDQEKHAERRRVAAEKARARAEVERLEQELAAAKAKLRGKTTTTTGTAAPKARASAPKGVHPCRNEGCDKVYDTPQGRSLHERLRCDHRAEAQAS